MMEVTHPDIGARMRRKVAGLCRFDREYFVSSLPFVVRRCSASSLAAPWSTMARITSAERVDHAPPVAATDTTPFRISKTRVKVRTGPNEAVFASSARK